MVGGASLVNPKFQCPCNGGWLGDSTQSPAILNCRELCMRHELGASSVRLPQDRGLAEIWLEALETPREDWDEYIKNNATGRGVRVSIAVHFHEVNVRLTAQQAKLVDGKTRFQDDARRYPEYGNPV